MRNSNQFPIQLLIGAVLFTTVSIAGLAYVSYSSATSLVQAELRRSKIGDLQKEILYLDEVLTMSARLAAASGEDAWEQRYNEYVPVLDEAIKKLSSLLDKKADLSATQKTNDANQKLIALESEIFKLNAQKRFKKAWQILNGAEYQAQKKIYAEGMNELNERINKYLEKERKANAQRFHLTFFISLLLSVLSIIAWALNTRYIVGLTHNLLLERDVAQRANLAKSLFLANISHELRTPMHGILSFARFGQQKFDSCTKEKLKSYFDEIYDSGSRLMRLLNDILDLSKLEAGKIEYSKKRNDLVDLAKMVKNETQTLVQEKGLKLEIQSQTPEVFDIVDGERLGQVLRNLVSNAIKFSERGGVIRIVVEQSLRVSRITVTNRGVGIPANEMESIFDKFAQSSRTRSGAGGTGLGLAICKEIVEQHGGRIWAESPPEGETKFFVELPTNETIAVKVAAA